jgi:hypothetical protein
MIMDFALCEFLGRFQKPPLHHPKTTTPKTTPVTTPG